MCHSVSALPCSPSRGNERKTSGLLVRPIDSRHAGRRKGLGSWEQVRTVRESMEVNVFSIFPNRFFHLHHTGDLAPALHDVAHYVVDRVTGASFPSRPPDDPANVIDAEDEFGKS